MYSHNLLCGVLHHSWPLCTSRAEVGRVSVYHCFVKCRWSCLADPYLSLVSPSSTTRSLSLDAEQGTHISASMLEGCGF